MRKTEIQAVLRDSIIDPRKDTAYKFVVDLGNPAYCITKALDILAGIDLNKIGLKAHDAALKQAITLLAMARCINATEKDTVKARSRSKDPGRACELPPN